MSIIKSYTDLEQSKKLAEILSIESADLYYNRYGTPVFIDKIVTHESIENDKYGHLIPCWSLAALLDVLPILERKGYQKAKPQLLYNVTTNKWIVDSHVYTTDAYDNQIDACYEMVLKLHKLKML